MSSWELNRKMLSRSLRTVCAPAPMPVWVVDENCCVELRPTTRATRPARKDRDTELAHRLAIDFGDAHLQQHLLTAVAAGQLKQVDQLRFGHHGFGQLAHTEHDRIARRVACEDHGIGRLGRRDVFAGKERLNQPLQSGHAGSTTTSYWMRFPSPQIIRLTVPARLPSRSTSRELPSMTVTSATAGSVIDTCVMSKSVETTFERPTVNVTRGMAAFLRDDGRLCRRLAFVPEERPLRS
jgi:hypothetical protein